MHRFRPALFAAVVVMLLSSLACRTLLGDLEISEDPGAPAQAEANPIPTKAVVASASEPAQVASTLRLDGSDLPDLDFGPPGFSPRDSGRPRLSGDPQTLDTLHFRIHYTLSGDDAVPSKDLNANGHPDYVEEVARALEYSWTALIEHFGWNAPPGDAGLGGDDRLDIYLEEVYDEGTAGYVEGDYEGGFYGDNPNSAQFEASASSSYMALDDDYAGYEDNPAPGVSLLDFMRSTAAHEFLHIVQYGYDAEEPHDWLWEASATWVQDELFNLVNDGNESLPAVFKSPDSCQLAYGGEERVEDLDHWYGMWIFIRYLSEQYGHESVRAVWERAIEQDGYAAWDRALADRGITLEELFRDFAVALLTRSFEEGRGYPTVRLEGELGVNEFFDPVDGVGQLGVDYIEILADQAVRVELDGRDLDGLLVGIADGLANLFPLSSAGANVDAGQFEHLYLAVLNLQRAETEDRCHFSSYTVAVTPASTTDQAQTTIAAGNFQAPFVEGLEDPDFFFDDQEK